MFYSIDRIENQQIIALDDSGNQLLLTRDQIQGPVQETDVIESMDGETFQKNQEETVRRKEMAMELQKKLFGNSLL